MELRARWQEVGGGEAGSPGPGEGAETFWGDWLGWLSQCCSGCSNSSLQSLDRWAVSGILWALAFNPGSSWVPGPLQWCKAG